MKYINDIFDIIEKKLKKRKTMLIKHCGIYWKYISIFIPLLEAILVLFLIFYSLQFCSKVSTLNTVVHYD